MLARFALALLITTSAAQAAPLPRCVSDQAEIDRIVQIMKANPKTPQKYDGYRESFKADTDVQLLSRLVYAETLAGNCSELNYKIFPYITDSIVARVRIRKGDVKSVVFQRNQHSSSMNPYGESRYLDLLCPKDQALWDAIAQGAEEILAHPAKPLRVPTDTTHYYLYMHAPRLKVPDWAGDNGEWPIVSFPGSDEIKPCIRFFRDSRWR